MTPTIGSVWRDNYDNGTGRYRYIRVLALMGDRVRIRRCSEDGSDYPKPSPTTMTVAERFNGGKAGFTLVCATPAEGSSE